MEVLRLVLMLAIFAWHILVHGYGFKDVAQNGMALTGNGACIILAPLFAPATYCFMFISGYYGMKFSVKKGLTIELWLLITSLLTFFICTFFFWPFSSGGFFKACFPISSKRWWFMTYYMIIFLLSPILNRGCESLDKNGFLLIISLLVLYQTISFIRIEPSGGCNFLGLLTIFLMGRYFRIHKIEIERKKALTIFLSCWAGLIGLLFLSAHCFRKWVFILLSYNTPLLMSMSVTLFYFVKGLKPRYSLKVNKLLRPVLFIYLITDGLFIPFYEWVASVFEVNVLYGVLLYVAVVVVCLLTGHAVIRLSEWILGKVNTHKFEDCSIFVK